MKLIIAAIALTVGACAQQPRPKPPPVAINTETPKCSSQDQCAKMWLEAQEAIGLSTGMRIRLITDTRIETFAPTTYGRMGGVVTKYPVAGGHEIRVRYECYRSTDCTDLKASATNLFNNLVAGLGR